MDSLNLLLATMTGILAAAVTGFLKKADAKIGAGIVSKLGNLTPVLVMGLTVGLPLLFKALHLAATDVPDAAVLASAPAATVVAILARELTVLIKSRYGSPAAP